VPISRADPNLDLLLRRTIVCALMKRRSGLSCRYDQFEPSSLINPVAVADIFPPVRRIGPRVAVIDFPRASLRYYNLSCCCHAHGTFEIVQVELFQRAFKPLHGADKSCSHQPDSAKNFPFRPAPWRISIWAERDSEVNWQHRCQSTCRCTTRMYNRRSIREAQWP
jgi:hypothetical protein